MMLFLAKLALRRVISLVAVCMLPALAGCSWTQSPKPYNPGPITTEYNETNKLSRLAVLIDEAGEMAKQLRLAIADPSQTNNVGSIQAAFTQLSVVFKNLNLAMTEGGVDTNRLAALLEESRGLLTNAKMFLAEVKKPSVQALTNVGDLAVAAKTALTNAERLVVEAEALGAGFALRQGLIPSDYLFLFEFQGTNNINGIATSLEAVAKSVSKNASSLTQAVVQITNVGESNRTNIATTITRIANELTTIAADIATNASYFIQTDSILTNVTSTFRNDAAILAQTTSNIKNIAATLTDKNLVGGLTNISAATTTTAKDLTDSASALLTIAPNLASIANLQRVWASVYSNILAVLDRTDDEKLFLEKQLHDIRETLRVRAKITNPDKWVPTNIIITNLVKDRAPLGAAIHAYITNLVSVGVPVGGRPPLRISFLVQNNTVEVKGFSGAYSDYERSTNQFGPILPVAREIQDLWREHRDSPGRRHLRTFRIQPSPECTDHLRTNKYSLDGVLSGKEHIRVIAEQSLVGLQNPSKSLAQTKFGLDLKFAWDPVGEPMLTGRILGFLGEDGNLYDDFMTKGSETNAVEIGRIHAVRYLGDPAPEARR